jgi:hypothetical protein
MAMTDLVKSGGVIVSNVAMTSNINSDIVQLGGNRSVSFDVKAISVGGNTAAAGNVYIQVCNDIEIDTPNWVNVAFTDGTSSVTAVAIASSVVSSFLDLPDIGGMYARARFIVSAAGTGTLRIVAHCKQ